MRNWHFGINSLYKSGHYSLEEGPWYVFFIDWLFDWGCGFFPAIPLPKIPMTGDVGEGPYKTNWNEYWGDTRQWVHCYIHLPVFNWCWDRIKTIYIDQDYDKLKEQFYEQDKKFFDEHEKMDEEIRAQDAEDKLEEHDRVELLFDTVANMGLTMEEEHLKAGMKGTIISVHENGKAFDVEFIQEKTMPVIITLNADQVRETYDRTSKRYDLK